jgi:hypothetical protein
MPYLIQGDEVEITLGWRQRLAAVMAESMGVGEEEAKARLSGPMPRLKRWRDRS